MASAARTGARGPSGSGAQGQAAPVGAGASPRRGAVTFHLRARSAQFGSFRLQRLVLIEVAAALLLAAWVVDPLALVPAAVVAVVLVLLAVMRRRGRAWHEWLGTVQALRARKRRAANALVPPGTEPAFAPAVECDPALRTYAYGDRDRRQVGMVGDGTFVTAVLQVESDATALRAERGRQPLPVGLVRDALEVDGIRLESAQIVQHTQCGARVASPSAVRSRQQLCAPSGPDRSTRRTDYMGCPETGS